MQDAARAQAPDGEGDSITITFKKADVLDERALAMSQRLAKEGRGMRKRVIVALLAAMEVRYLKTGELVTPIQIDDLISSLEVKR